jgi:hypothetical protein
MPPPHAARTTPCLTCALVPTASCSALKAAAQASGPGRRTMRAPPSQLVTASTSSGPLKATHTSRCSGSRVTSLQQAGVPGY